MQERGVIEIKKHREEAARLIYRVITGRMSVKDALRCFPEDGGDATVAVSWHALCHYEADEDIRFRDEVYRKEQDEYMEYLVQTLSAGAPLPENIIDSYKPYHPDSLISGKNTIKSIINKLSRSINC